MQQEQLNNLALSIVPGELPDAIILQEKISNQSAVLKAHLDCWELDKAYLVLNQICVGMSELNNMHQRKIGYDRGLNAGYREGVERSKTVETLVGELARTGRTVVIVQGGVANG